MRGFILRQEVYHCSREELDAMDQNDVIIDWELRQAVQTASERKAEEDKKRYNKGKFPSR